MKRLTLALAASALFGVSAQAQTVLTTSSWVGPTHTLSLAQKEWCETVEQRTNGKVKCNILPRAPTAPPGTYDAIKSGVLDLSFTVHGYTPGRFVLTQMTELPFLGNSAEALSVAYNRIASKHPEFTAEHQGVKVLAFFTHGPGIIFNTKQAITKVDDLANLKFRVGGGMVNEISKSLNMNVTLKPAPDSYELLSGGVMDGTLFPAESTESFRIEKIIRHATTFPGGLYNTSFAFVMNPATWAKIAKADQAAIEKLSGEAAARSYGLGWESVDRRGSAFMQANGVDKRMASKAFVNEVAARTASLEKKWIDAAKAKGLKNAEQVLKEYRAEVAKLK